MTTPCGGNIGHGDYCVEGHLCDHCAHIRRLEMRVKELEEEATGLREGIHRNARERNVHLDD
jgi:hypothetical protein